MANILEDTERRAVYLGRLASGLLKAKIVPTLEQAYKAARLILLDAGDNVSITKRNQVTAAIRRAITEIDNDGWADVTKELEQIAIYDAGYYAGLVGSAVSIKLNTPVDEKITSYINKSLMSLADGNKIDAGTWSQFVKSKVLNDIDRIDSIIANGYSKGATTNEILRELKLLTEGQLTKQAEALVRTGVIHYSNQAREAMFIDNDVDEVVFVATLDNRTTLTCSSKDGKRYKIDDPAKPVPPLHFNAICEGELINTLVGYKKIQDVNVGDYVLTHRGRYRKVLTVMSKRNDTDFIRVIRTDSGQVVRVTDEHPILLCGKGWVRADVVEVGDNLFKYGAKVMETNTIPPTVERSPYNYPSIFDGESVFFEVGSKSCFVSTSVNLDNNFPSINSEVGDSVVRGELMGVFRKSKHGEVLHKPSFSEPRAPSLVLNLGSDVGFVSGFCSERVSCGHSFGVSQMDSAVPLALPESPMTFANTNTVCDFNFCGYFGALRPTHLDNSVHPAPSAHRAICKGEFTLNCPESLSMLKMMGSDEFGEVGFIGKFEHELSPCVVESISIVEHKGAVYNLEVDSDNSFVASGIVVHNCRSTMIPAIAMQDIDTRAAVGGQKGAEAADEFEQRQDKTDKKVKYRGRKDSDIFKVEQIKYTQYDEWLKRQPTWFVESALGKGKAELFLSGKLSLAQFVDLAGRPLTLAELRALDGNT